MSNTKLPISDNMIKLYGEDAEAVNQRCYEVNPWFGEFVRTFAYDELWDMEELSLSEKSLLVVVALSSLAKAEQLNIHLKGYFNLGGSFDDIHALFSYLYEQNIVASKEHLFKELGKFAGVEGSQTLDVTNDRTISLIQLAHTMALGNNNHTKSALAYIESNGFLTRDEINTAIKLLMIYCGCPAAMNAFAVLKEIDDGNIE